MPFDHLFSKTSVGGLDLPSRIVMAPMTRLRADGPLATAAMADYYAQRASAGLIITECTMISDTSAAYINAPGLYADNQIDPWRRVADAVHEAGGRIFLQLWHCGRVAHVSLMPDRQLPLAPSAVAGEGDLHTLEGKRPMSVPRAMLVPEIIGITRAFGKAADRARRAGFDGVELHGAFGYLIDQFLRDGANRRDDDYGGAPENRIRFLLGVIAAAQQSMERRVGLKLSPVSSAHGMTDSDPAGLYAFLLNELNQHDLAYVHIMEPLADEHIQALPLSDICGFAREHYQGMLIANGGFSAQSAEQQLAAGKADLVSFGTAFIANPDLPARLRAGAALAAPDPATVYGVPGRAPALGYTDYPFMK